MTESDSTAVSECGSGEFIYHANATWPQLPEGIVLGEAVGVAVDSRDRLYVFTRSGSHPVMIFERDGRLADYWGGGQFVRPHGIYIGPDDSVYLTDDQDHTVRKYTADGDLLLTLGTSGQPSDSGVMNADYRTIQRAAAPFNLPTNVALAPDGSLYVSDGYGNCCIHRFAPGGSLLHSWGAAGTGPAEFQIPHGIGAASDGRVVVADRENSRLQWFTDQGEWLEDWSDVARPCNVFLDDTDHVFVAELGWHAGTPDPKPDQTGGRVSVFNRHGDLLSRWGGGDDPYAVGDFAAPHDIWVDSHGDIYVGEVTLSAAARRGLVGSDCPSLQKFVKQAP